MNDSIDYSEFSNVNFFVRPRILKERTKGLDDKQRLTAGHRLFLEGVYHYANSDRDETSRKRTVDYFGVGTIKPENKEDSAYFIGSAALREAGYNGSPYEYWLRQNKQIPTELQTDEDARIYIGKQLLDEMRSAYDKRKQDETELAAIQKELPNYLADAVRMAGYTGQLNDKKVADALNRVGAWEKMSPSVDKARTAWLRMQNLLQNVDAMQEIGHSELNELANELSNEDGELDEMALLAFSSALQKHAEEMQSTDSKFWANAVDSYQNFVDAIYNETPSDKAAFEARMAAYGETLQEGGTQEEAIQNAMATYNRPSMRRLKGEIRNAMNVAMSPSEQASAFAKVMTEGGTLLGGSAAPVAAGAAMAFLTKGKNIGGITKAVLEYGAGVAVSYDSIVNQAVTQAYVEGVDNPEEYGKWEGTGQALSENLTNIGGAGIRVFSGVNKALAKGAAKVGTSKILSNAAARTTLSFFGTTAIEGTMELAEEELGSYLGSRLNALARWSGETMTEQKHDWGATIKEMPAHQIAAIYAFGGALGLMGVAANYKKAQAWSMDIDNLKASGFSDKAARDIVSDGFVHAREMEEVQNSDLSQEEKHAKMEKLSNERLEYLGKQFKENFINATPEEIKSRSKQQNEDFIYKALLAQAIRNGVDEQALQKLGYMGERQPNGNYLLTYEESADTPDGKPKLVQKEWNRDQLTGFLSFQRNTDVHQQLREFQSQITAMQFAKSVESADELAIKLANLRDVPVNELATIQRYGNISIPLFEAFAKREAANIAADMAQGMSAKKAENASSKILPGVARKDVIAISKAAEERKKNAIATGEIKKGASVTFPGVNLSRLDGSSLVAFMGGKINTAQMLEEMMEARIKQRVNSGNVSINELGKALQHIQSRLPGVKLLPKNKTEFNAGDITEAYSHLAVANMLTTPEYLSHLPEVERSVIQDVMGNVRKAQHYKLIADAWQTFKNSEEGKAYLENGGKGLMEIMSEAGFTFGKHFTTAEATAEQKVKVLEGRNFIPDYKAETKLLMNNVKANEKLAKQDAVEAKEDVVIPAKDSITGEEIVVTPDEQEAIQNDPNEPEKTEEEKLIDKLRTPEATWKDFATFCRNHVAAKTKAIELGLYIKTQDGEPNPAFEIGQKIAIYERAGEPYSDTEIQELIISYEVNKSIVEIAGELTTSGSLKRKADAAKKTAKLFRDTAKRERELYNNAIADGSTRPLPPAPKWPLKNTDKETLSQEDVVSILSPMASKDKTRYVLSFVSKRTEFGETTYAATDGRRLSALTRKATKADGDENSLIEIATNEEKTESQAKINYPNWRLIVPTSFASEITLDIAPYLAMKNFKKKGGTKAGFTLVSPSMSHRFVVFKANNKRYIVDALKFRDAVEQLAKLAKQLGFDSTVKVQLPARTDGNISLVSEHKGWKWNAILAPVILKDGAEQVGNIIVGDTPQIYTGVSGKSEEQVEKLRKSADDAEALAAEHEQAAVELKQKADDVAKLEKQLGDKDQAVRYFAGLNDNYSIGAVDARFHEIRRGEMYNIMPSLVSNKKEAQIGKDIFERATGLKLPGTPEGNKAMAEEWAANRKAEQKANAASFAIEETEIDERFAGHPLAERLSNYMRREAKRFSRVLNDKSPQGVAIDAIASAQAVIGSLDKYVHNNTIPIKYRERLRLKTLQRLIEKYAQIIKAGSTRSFYSIDKHEQEELLAAIKEVSSQIDFESIDAISDKQYQTIRSNVEAELMPELYRKHATELANSLSKQEYITPAETAKRIKTLQQAAKTGHVNNELTANDLQESGYNSQPIKENKIQVLKAYAEKQLKELQQSEESNRKAFAKDKASTLQALQRIIKEGYIAANSTLGKVEQKQLTEAVEAEAEAAIDKETRQGVLDFTREEWQKSIEEKNKELVRLAAKGRVGQLLQSMLNEAGDILDSYLKRELVKKMTRITRGVKIKRRPSKRLKGKMTAAGYRDLEQAVSLMGMSTRAKQDAEEAIDLSQDFLSEHINDDVNVIRNGTPLLEELAERIEREGGKVTAESLSNALTSYKYAVAIFADLPSKTYKQTLATAKALHHLVTYHRSQWDSILEQRTAEMKQYLSYFMQKTSGVMGTDNAVREAVEKKKSILTFLPDSMMNSAQLFLALSSYEPLKPLLDDMRYKLANAQVAREKHMKAMRAQELAAFGRIIGMKPFNEAGYTTKQLAEISKKFDDFYQENNQVIQTEISITRPAKDEYSEATTYKWKGTKWEALGLILTYRQEHYKVNAEYNGFTPDVLSKLQKFIGDKLMAFGNAIQQAIINDGTMQVYEAREGVPMQDNPLYFPASININTMNTTREEPLTNPYNPAAIHDFLRVRVKHHEEAKAANAYITYRQALASRSNYIYLDPVTENMTRLLAHKEFANRLKTLIGSSLFEQLTTTLKEIRGAGHQETSLQDFAGIGFSGALSASVLTTLPFNPGSYLRQFSAVASAGLMPDISPAALAKYALLTRHGKGHISITGVLKLDAFTTRERDNAFVNEMAAMGNNVKYSKLLNWAKTGMNIMDKLDLLANAMSAAVVYNHKYDKLKEMGGYTEAEIEKLCEQEVNAYVKLLAQPMSRVDKSALYWTLSNWAVGRALLYMGSESINKIGMMRANYIIKRNEGQSSFRASMETLAKMGVTVGVANFVLESLIAWLTGNTPDDKDDSVAAWATAMYLNAAFGQYLDIMPILGQFTRQFFSPYASLKDASIVAPGSDMFRSVPKMYEMLTDDKKYTEAQWTKESTKFLRELTEIAGYAGGAYSQWQWFSSASAALHSITAGMNFGYFVARSVENDSVLAKLVPDSSPKPKGKKPKKKNRLKSKIEELLTPEKKKKKKAKG